MARKSRAKQTKSKIFIFVEGETELAYFEKLKQILRLSTVGIDVLKLDNSGSDYIEKAKRQMKNNPKFKRESDTQVFVVFDKDDLTNQELQKLLDKAENESMTIVFSNITFEVWLLGHFEKMTPGIISKTELIKRLTKYLGQPYKKGNSNQIAKFIDRYVDAIDNVGTISIINFDKQSTNVGRVVKSLDAFQ